LPSSFLWDSYTIKSVESKTGLIFAECERNKSRDKTSSIMLEMWAINGLLLERPAKQSQVFFEKIFSDIKDVNA